MRHISQENIARLLRPLASEQEMGYIVKSLAVAFKKYEVAAASIESQINSISLLEQSILAKAFRGELVPQNPNDEPAAKLLERIQREKHSNEPARASRGRRKAKL